MSVYLQAARKLPLGPYGDGAGVWCCCDIIRRLPTSGPNDNRAFSAVFMPDDADGYDMWWPHPRFDTTETQQQRLLALLFMHWMTVNPC